MQQNEKNEKTRTRIRTRGSELKFAFQRTRFGSARARASSLRWEQEGAQHDPTARGSSGALAVNACRIRAGGEREARSRKYGKDGNKGGHDARPRTHGEGRRRGGRLTLLQKVTHRTQRSNSVFREAASRGFGGAGGFGGESDTWTESPVKRRASILTRTCTEDGSTSTEEAKARPGAEKFMTENISARVKDEVRRY